MLSEGTELFMEGEKALVRNGYHFDDVEDRTIGGAAFKIHLGLIELTILFALKHWRMRALCRWTQ